MTQADFTESVRAELRAEFAKGREVADLVVAIEGSRLWERLTTIDAKIAAAKERLARNIDFYPSRGLVGTKNMLAFSDYAWLPARRIKAAREVA